MRWVLPLTLLALVAAPGPAHAEDPDEAGFGEDPGFDFGVVPEIEAQAAPSPWSLRGFLRSDWAFWTERMRTNPNAKRRQNLDLELRYKRGILRAVLAGHAEVDLAYLVDRGRYDRATLDTYEWQAINREAFVAVSLGPAEITLGSQIVAWGEGDMVSPLDVVNPRDNREPGLADLEDLRMPVLATRVGVFPGNHRLELMVVHESFMGWLSPPFGPFSPLPALVPSEPPPGLQLDLDFAARGVRYDHVQPRLSLRQQQGFLRWVYKGPALDLGLYAATVLDKQGVVILPTLQELLGSGPLVVRLDHRRYWLAGSSGAVPVSSFVLKWEHRPRLQYG